MRKIKFLKLLSGFFIILRSVLFKTDYRKLELKLNLNLTIIILSIIGVLRVLLSILLRIRFHNGVQFIFDPGMIFAMLIFPVFLAFFPAMILDYFFKKWEINITTRTLLGFFSSLQVIHLTIPFFEYIQRIFHIQCYIPLIPAHSYLKAAVSPLAFSPLIFLITNACTLGITLAWIISTITTIKLGLVHKAPILKFILLLMGIFYIIYVLTYPTYLLFYSHGNNFYYGMTYLLGSVGPVLYFKMKGVK